LLYWGESIRGGLFLDDESLDLVVGQDDHLSN
jgi:hypothetical protein